MSSQSSGDPVLDAVLTRLSQGLPPTDDAELLEMAAKVVENGFEVDAWSKWARNLAVTVEEFTD